MLCSKLYCIFQFKKPPCSAAFKMVMDNPQFLRNVIRLSVKKVVIGAAVQSRGQLGGKVAKQTLICQKGQTCSKRD